MLSHNIIGFTRALNVAEALKIDFRKDKLYKEDIGKLEGALYVPKKSIAHHHRTFKDIREVLE